MNVFAIDLTNRTLLINSRLREHLARSTKRAEAKKLQTIRSHSEAAQTQKS